MRSMSNILQRDIAFLCLALLLAFGCMKHGSSEEPQSITSSHSTVKDKPDSPFLVVLGVAQDAGYPQASCGKTCCKPALENPGQRKRVSCLGLVDPISQKVYLFDATPDFTSQIDELTSLLDASIKAPSGVFLTHAHIGHYTGLMFLGREAMGTKQVPVFAMPRMTSFLESNGPWSQLVSLENVVLEEMQKDEMIDLGNGIRVTPLLVPHRDEFSETVGFRIQGPEKTALFIPDINKWELWDKSLPDELAKVDAAFLDATFFQNGELPGRDMSEIPHPFVEETMALLKDLSDSEKSKVHFIHFNHTNPLLQDQGPARNLVLEKGFRIAFEGQVLPL